MLIPPNKTNHSDSFSVTHSPALQICTCWRHYDRRLLIRIVVLYFLLTSAFSSASWPSTPSKPLKEMFSDSSFVAYAEAIGNLPSINPKETLTKYKIIDVLKGNKLPYVILRKEIYLGSESSSPSSEVYKTLLFLHEAQNRKHYSEKSNNSKPKTIYEGTVVFLPRKWNPDIGND